GSSAKAATTRDDTSKEPINIRSMRASATASLGYFFVATVNATADTVPPVSLFSQSTISTTSEDFAAIFSPRTPRFNLLFGVADSNQWPSSNQTTPDSPSACFHGPPACCLRHSA